MRCLTIAPFNMIIRFTVMFLGLESFVKRVIICSAGPNGY